MICKYSSMLGMLLISMAGSSSSWEIVCASINECHKAVHDCGVSVFGSRGVVKSVTNFYGVFFVRNLRGYGIVINIRFKDFILHDGVRNSVHGEIV